VTMEIDSQRGLITIWLVQHAGFPGQGGQALGVFKHAAMARFGTAAPLWLAFWTVLPLFSTRPLARCGSTSFQTAGK
jgi:hypothetical protein